MEIFNRKAKYDYSIIKEIECGIALVGTEIKSIKKGSADLRDSYAHIRNNEVYLLNMYIDKYKEGNINNHEERRTRKLLLHKSEIKKLKKEIDINKYTLVPLKLYITRGKVKILLALAKGKKTYDKRESIKRKEQNRNMKSY